MPSAVLVRVEPRIVGVSVTSDSLSFDLADGRTITAPIGWYPRLACGTPVERNNVQIVGAGYSLHWPDLDEDISVGALTLGKPSQECPSSLQRWLAERTTAIT